MGKCMIYIMLFQDMFLSATDTVVVDFRIGYVRVEHPVGPPTLSILDLCDDGEKNLTHSAF